MAKQDDLNRARERFRRGDPDGAAEILEPIVESDPSNVAARLLLARCYSRMRQGQDAVAEIEVALEAEPENTEALTLRGAEHYFADELEAASEVLEGAIERDPSAIEAYVRLSQVRTDEKLYEEAAELLSQAEEKAGEERALLALVRMGRVYRAMQGRKHAEALQLISDNEELWPESPYIRATVLSNEAVIHARQRDFSRARVLLVEALDVDPYFYSARSLLGQIAALQRDHAFAVEQLSQVVENDDTPGARVRYALATSMNALGRHEEASQHYAKALEGGLTGLPAFTARLNVLVPNPIARTAIGILLLLIIAFFLIRTLPPLVAIVIVALIALLGRQILRGA